MYTKGNVAEGFRLLAFARVCLRLVHVAGARPASKERVRTLSSLIL